MGSSCSGNERVAEMFPSHRRGVGDKINFVSVIAGTLDLNATSVGPNAVVAGSHSRAKRMVASQSSREMDMSNDIRILGTAELDTVAGGTTVEEAMALMAKWNAAITAAGQAAIEGGMPTIPAPGLTVWNGAQLGGSGSGGKGGSCPGGCH